MYVSGRLRICSSWVSFWYWSVDFFFFADSGRSSFAPSKWKLSFSSSANGFAFALAGRAGAFFCFLADGGVFESRESSFIEFMSTSEFSSSDSGLARFFGFGFGAGAVFVGFKVVCFVFAAFGFGAVAAFFAGAFAFYNALVLGILRG